MDRINDNAGNHYIDNKTNNADDHKFANLNRAVVCPLSGEGPMLVHQIAIGQRDQKGDTFENRIQYSAFTLLSDRDQNIQNNQIDRGIYYANYNETKYLLKQLAVLCGHFFVLIF